MRRLLGFLLLVAPPSALVPLVYGCESGAPLTEAPAPAVEIADTTYEGTPHFLISTEGATYWYDKAGGGFSRIVDRDGNDWVAFRREPWDRYPASAASAYRGLPNLVFGSDESGAGHPGFERCLSVRTGERSITSVTRSEGVQTPGRWRWTWTFHDTHATLDVEAVDPDHPYWFLYEGPPAGRFAPDVQYWGTSEGGPRRATPDYYGGATDVGTWRWAYFGDDEAPRVFFAAQHERDDEADLFGYLGNTEAGLGAPDGMVVFGFGRADGARPLLTRPHTFTIGFIETAVTSPDVHERVGDEIEALLVGGRPLEG